MLINTLNPVNKHHPLNRGLIAWWLILPHTYGASRWFDLLKLNHAAFTNSPSWTSNLCRPCSFGNLSFDGSNNYLTASSTNLLTGKSEFSISAWVFIQQLVTTFRVDCIINSYDNAVGDGFRLSLDGGSSGAKWKFAKTRGYTEAAALANVGYSNNVWTHLLGTSDASGLTKLYVNGILQTTTGTITGALRNNLATYIGQDYTAGSRLLGKVDDIKLWSRGLNDSEAFEVYRESITGYRRTLNNLSFSRFTDIENLVSSGATNYTKTINEAMGLSDSSSRLSAYIRSNSDNIGITDSFNRLSAYIRSNSDNIGITDSTNKAYGKIINDQVGLTDLIAKVIEKVISETVGSTDNRSLLNNYIRSISENLGITDTQAKNLIKIISDTIGTTDSTSRLVNYIRTNSDIAGITDSVTTNFAGSSNYTATINDLVGITDNILRAISYIRSNSDNIGITDTISKLQAKIISNSIGITDSNSKIVSFNRTLSEQLNITDLETRISNYIRLVNDVEGIRDTATKNLRGSIVVATIIQALSSPRNYQ